MPEKIAVIGAGIAGIAAAVRLAAKGFRVEVFEKNEGPGGKMSEIRHDGFRFDTGPSLFTLPGKIDELFDLAGEKSEDYFHHNRLDLVCRYFYPDGMVLNGYGHPDAFIRELKSVAGEDESRLRRYLDESRYIYDLTDPVFLTQSIHLPKNYTRKEFLRAFFRIYRIKPLHTLHRLNLKYFRHPNTIRLFDRFATYNGSDPYKTPATMMVIPHLEHNVGAYFPEGGMYSIAASLVRLAEKLGVEFHFNSEVEEIVVSGQRAELAGLRILRASPSGPAANRELRIANCELRTDFSRIITDLDIYFVYKNLLKAMPFPEKWFRHERSTSALIFYWGMKIQSGNLDVHNILFAQEYREEFRCLFELKTLHPDPTVYIFISSKVVREDAPEGCENWFVMVNTPPDEGQDWGKMIEDIRSKIEDKIGRMLKIDVRQHRLFEFVLDPPEIERKTGSFRGSLYGNSSNSTFSAFRRHPNFSRIKGLYHVGGSVHPGGGIPLCLSSAKIVADIIT
jgi:phytoene desaturase